jgi:hypothetical protein
MGIDNRNEDGGQKQQGSAGQSGSQQNMPGKSHDPKQQQERGGHGDSSRETSQGSKQSQSGSGGQNR